MPKIEITNYERIVDYNPAISLLNNFHILGVPIESVCGGRGNCGTCRIRVLEGRKFMTPWSDMEKFKLNQEEREDGWRLGCQSHALRDLKIEIPDMKESNERQEM